GVAPLNQDSGQHRGRRIVWGGRASVRAPLYMATLVATRHNPVIRTFYDRLRAVGKPPLVAIVAAMRKLLTILNAMVRHQQAWEAVPVERYDSCCSHGGPEGPHYITSESGLRVPTM